MNRTPRTDAATLEIAWFYEDTAACDDLVRADFARELERELAAAEHDISRLCRTNASLASELEQLREDMTSLQRGEYL